MGTLLTVIGSMAVVFELSPIANTKFAKEWIYGPAGRTASRILSFAVFAIGLCALLTAGGWHLVDAAT